ncbi:5300_t:CDS:2 [Entrophospora sp. SA101]|nr:5298_t:CDS:2 [Entrophospora sp. SA101]CAJ0832551.1 5300_t:CDS:2 [Entrophospora sp. SA101]
MAFVYHNTGRQWCKSCNPERLIEDDPFLEYIPYGNLEIIKRIGEGGYGVAYHAKWHDGLRYCDGNVKSKHKVIDVAMKEIKSGYDIFLDFLSKIEAYFKCF